MDQGIIKNLKTLYRKELVHMTLAHLEETILNLSSTAIDVSSKISILQAVSFVAKSWRAVKEATIINCFRKAGFFTLSPCVIDENDEEFSLPEINNGEDYNNIDVSYLVTVKPMFQMMKLWKRLLPKGLALNKVMMITMRLILFLWLCMQKQSLKYLDCNAILLNRDLTMQHILC